MTGIDPFYAALLGIIEGLTEFLPVSSTGHLILFVDMLKLSGPPGHVFEIVIQVGAICAILWMYMKRFWHVAKTLHSDSLSRNFIVNITLAFLPAVILGLIFHDFIKAYLFNATVVSVALIIGGLAIIVIERMKLEMKIHSVEMVPWKRALGIGLIQVLAMIPGTSRSGATIMGGVLLGLDRKTAAEFSFFLAVPTLLGATVLDLIKSSHALTVDNELIIGIGFVTAFITALFVVKALIWYVSNHSFTVFAYYRIVLGIVMLALIYA